MWTLVQLDHNAWSAHLDTLSWLPAMQQPCCTCPATLAAKPQASKQATLRGCKGAGTTVKLCEPDAFTALANPQSQTAL